MRYYKRKSNRQEWSEVNMAKAIEACLKKEMGYKKAATSFDVPRSTLRDKVKRAQAKGYNGTQAAEKQMGRFKTVFTNAQENELISYLLEMETKLFGISFQDLQKLAYQLAERNGVSHNFSRNTQEAGKEWVRGFRKRHPEITLRTPEPTSAARAMGFNRTAVKKFFDCLTDVYDKYKFPPTRIFNCDETGLTTVAKNQGKIFAKRGRKQVGTLSSAERGQLVTVELCFSASGQYIPPLLIFPRQRMKAELMDGAPPGAISACHKSGWMQSEIFVQWLKHFISHVRPTNEDPVLLLLDGHASHTKNLEAITLARENNVVMLCFPPHCTHRLQPLDVGFMAPLSTYYGQEIKVWLRTNPGRVVTQFQIAKLLGNAYVKAATLETAINSFAKTGIWPLNINVFTEIDFAASDVTERDLNETENVSVRQFENDQVENEIWADVQELIERDCQTPPPSNDVMVDNAHRRSASTSFTIAPTDVCPVPKGKRRESNRRRGKSVVLTSTPYKEELEANQSTKVNDVKKKVSFGGNKMKKTTIKKTVPPRDSSTETESDEDDEDPPCAKCHRLYSKSKGNEGWVQCRLCKKWFHESCTGLSDDELGRFLCSSCVFK